MVRRQFIKDNVIMAELGNGMTVQSAELCAKPGGTLTNLMFTGYVIVCENNISGGISVKINPSGIYDYNKGSVFQSGLMLCERSYPGMEEVVRREYPDAFEKLAEIL